METRVLFERCSNSSGDAKMGGREKSGKSGALEHLSLSFVRLPDRCGTCHCCVNVSALQRGAQEAVPVPAAVDSSTFCLSACSCFV